MPKVNNSTNLVPDVEPGDIAALTKQTISIANWGDINIKSAEEIRERCQKYFDYCIKMDKRPMVMGLCLALGVTKQTLTNWENEQSGRGLVIRKAKDIIRSLIEEWSLTGKLSPPVAIFWSKNFLSMSDSITVEAKTNEAYRPVKSPEQIAKELDEDLPPIPEAEVFDI